MLGSLASFAVMAVAIRYLAARHGTFAILFFRSAGGLLILSAVLARTGLLPIKSRQPWLHVLRNALHFAAQWGWTWGLAILPLAKVTALEFTSPIWSLLFAFLILGERLTPARLVAVATGFLGVLVILRPGLIAIDPASLAVLGAGAGYALCYVLVKRITRTDTPLAVVFWMSVLQLPMGLVPALTAWVPPLWSEVPAMAVLGFTGVFAHYCMSRAFKLADALTVIPIDFLRLPLTLGLGLWLYGEAFDPWTVAGGALICAGIWYNLTKDATTVRR